MPPAPTARRVLRQLTALVGSAVLVVVLLQPLHAQVPIGSQLLMYGTACGTLVAVALRTGAWTTVPFASGAVVGAVVGAATVSRLDPRHLAAAVGLGVAIAAGTVVLRRMGVWRFRDVADLLRYALVAVTVAVVVGLVVGLVGYGLSGGSSASRLVVWLPAAGTVLFGFFVVAPVVVTAVVPERVSRRDVALAVGCTACTIGVAVYGFFMTSPTSAGVLSWPFLTMTAAYVAAVTLGVAVASSQIAILGMIIVVATAAGHGRFAVDAASKTDQVTIAVLFAAGTGAVVLAVAVLRDTQLHLLRRTQRSLQLFDGVVDAASSVIFAKDYSGDRQAAGSYILVNSAWERAAQHIGTEVLGQTDYTVYPAEIARQHVEMDHEVLRTDRPLTIASEGIGPGGQGRRYRVDKFPLRDEDGRAWGVGGIAVDVTESLLSQAREQRQVALLRAVFEQSPLPAVLVRRDSDGGLVVSAANAAMDALIGGDSTCDGDISACVAAVDRPTVRMVLWALATGEIDTARPRDVRLLRGDGDVRWVRMSAAPVLDATGRPVEVVVQFEDFTARRDAERALNDQALRDQVTRLPNRRSLDDRLAGALARLKRRDGAVTVLFCDMDRFKDVNDSLGHHAGDALLIEVADRLRSAVRPEDFVARLGGDEFVVVAEGLADLAAAAALAARLQERVRASWRYGERSFRPAMSVGVVATSDPAVTGDELLRRADLAMYQAKDVGRDRIEVYANEVDDAVQRALLVQGELRHAIESGGLELRYQPIVRLSDRGVVKAEALVRMRDSSGVLLSPDEFVGEAESSGLITPMGAWVAEHALADLAVLRRRYPDLRTAINVSPTQLRDEGFSGYLLGTMQDAGIDPSWVSVEVTESALLNDPGRSVAELRSLSSAGVGISLDDFGTGYSSLTWLTQLPVDVVKIDRSFTKDLGVDGRKASVVRAVISVSHELGLTTVAEGIETEAQCELLRAWGCDLGQGYLFGRPAALDEPPWSSTDA